MHWIGKASAWLLALLVIVGVMLSSKLVRQRNEWTKKLEDAKRSQEGLVDQVAKAHAELTRLRGEHQRATQIWGKFYDVDTVIQNPNAGAVVAGIGSFQDLRQGQWLYGFEILPDGKSVYRGDFVADTVRETETLLRPNWRLRRGDTRGWQNGKWRWRVQLPPSYPNLFDELEQTLLRQDELLADREQALQVQESLVEAATAQLELREAELVGGPQLPKEEKLDPEFRQGLVATLEQVEEARNAELIVIDRLRRSVRDLRQQIEATQKANQDLVRQLPQPPAAISRTR